MNYSYTQLAHYLACPRRYRYRYLEGWQEKDRRANLVFGRVFESSLAAYFRREDSSVTFFQQWSQYRDAELDYSSGDNWDKMLQVWLSIARSLRSRRPRTNSSTSKESPDQVYEADLNQ